MISNLTELLQLFQTKKKKPKQILIKYVIASSRVTIIKK